MPDRVTANLPSRNFDATEAFYATLGFSAQFKDSGWMILARGPLVIEFFPFADLDPKTSSFSACVRVDDLDALYAAFTRAGLSNNNRSMPRLEPARIVHGLRMFFLVDGDGSLLRCIDNNR